MTTKTNKPNILFLITKSNWGGAQKYVFDLATSDITKRFNVSVICGGDGELVKRLRDSNVEVNTLNKLQRNINIFNDFFSTYEIYKYIKTNKPNIVHLNSSKMGLLGGIAARLAHADAIVFTAHGWPFNENRSMFSKLIFRILMLLTVALSHKTIAVSQNVIESLKPPYRLRSKMQVIYNGIKFSEYKPLPKLSSASNGNDSEKVKHVVSIGELHDIKGHLGAIQILRHIRNIHYHIIGEGEERKKIENYIQKNDLAKKVTLHGHVKNANFILPQFDLFLLPSKSEALPYVIFEALQAKLPIVSRAVGGIPEVTKDIPSAKLFKHNSELISIIENFHPEPVNWDDRRFKYETMVNETRNLYISMLK
jgi:glycosyltransferase involved in cell wall biosynthesis